ncbi:protein serine threonine phosphatase 2C [Lentinula edodes]|uniref:Protein serine threonine phosphatase 2C n=1 Tax=Lentinula edodes TaxID=5353 RepID=A0A1Q3EPJ3_LENED|nr:protein serine threonine phosphatase 2C [Lentinula edodes]
MEASCYLRWTYGTRYSKLCRRTPINKEVITTFDDSLLVDLLSGIPSESQLSSLTEDEVPNILGGDHRSKVLRSMQGTTVIIALTNPDNEDLWVASLGDSYAVLGIQSSYDDRRELMFLSSYHNGLNPRERERLIRGHPNEPEVLSRNRVLGGLAVTRALGDYPYKLPSIYTDRVFLHASQSRNQRELIDSVSNRNLTPPYISNIPDVKYVDLKSKRLGDSPSGLNTDKKGNNIALRHQATVSPLALHHHHILPIIHSDKNAPTTYIATRQLLTPPDVNPNA